MKRILSILTALMLFCMGWVENANAQQVTVNIVNGTTGETTYGSWNNNTKTTWTSNITSGLAGLTLTKSGGTFDKYSNWNGRYNLAYKPGQNNRDYILTLTAPSGYVITGYSFEARRYNSGTFTITKSDGTSITPANNPLDRYTTIDMSRLCTQTEEITISTNNANYYLAIANFSVTLSPFAPDPQAYMAVSPTAADNLEAGKWYVMYDRGNYRAYLYEDNANGLWNRNYDPFPTVLPKWYFVSLVDLGDGNYYIRTGMEHYFNSFSSSSQATTTSTPSNAIKVAKINNTNGHFYLQSANNVVLDANPCNAGPGTVVGWGTTAPTTTDGNNDWAFYPVDNSLSGHTYYLYCSYDDGDYPVYNESGTPQVSTSSATTPQVFVFRENAGALTGADVYRLQCAEGDDKFLAFGSAAPRTASFAENPSNYSNYLLLNNGISRPSAATDGGNWVDDPYYNLVGWYTYGGNNFFPTFRGPRNGEDAITADDRSAGNIQGNTQVRGRNHTTQYNYRWRISNTPYVVYDLVVQDAGGNAVNDAYIRYSNPNDAGITRSAQKNGGFFAIMYDVTPMQGMFSLQDSPQWKITGYSRTGNTITITVASAATTTIIEGRYVFKNRGRGRYLVTANNKFDRSQVLGRWGDEWDVVSTDVSGEYIIRNVDLAKYIKWTDSYDTDFSLVESAAEATRVVFSTETGDVVQTGCVAIKKASGGGDSHFHMAANGRTETLVRWRTEAASDWYLYPIDEPEEGLEYLILNKQSSKYATRGADDNAQLVQNAKGYVDAANSVWSLMNTGAGCKIANGGTTNLLNDPRGSANSVSAFTVDGRTWYIQKDRVENAYFNIANREDIDGPSHNLASAWNNAGGGGTVISLWSASGNAGSCWRFVPVDFYYLNALAYLDFMYDESHKNDLFYFSEAGYLALKAAPHSTAAQMIAIANSIYTFDPQYLNMPENGKDYLIMNVGLNVIYRQERYVYTDASKMVLADTPYNSSYFWHVEKDGANAFALSQCCYGTTGGEYPSADKRYIAGTQPAQGSGTNWQYTNVKPANSLSFQLYATNEIPFFGTASMIVGGNRMNGSGYNVITWNAQDNNCKWKFITVEEASASLIATAETAVAVAQANAGAAFTLTAEVIDDIEDAIDALKADYNYVNYYILEQLLKDHTNYYWLANGRYLVRNYEFDPDGDGNVNDTETYLTSLINPEGVVEDAICYWSIWDITNVGLGQYSVVNEGNKHILAPGRQLDGNPNTDERNQGLLFYDTSASAFQVGNPEAGDEATLYFYPAAEVSAVLPPSDVVSGDFAAISVPSQVAQGKYMNMYTASDHVASYSTTPTSRKGCFWQFIPINSQNETNHEGTHSGEAEMFANQVNGLAGYVGGVVTLDNVESVPCLNDIVLLRNAAVAALDGGTALNFTNSPYEAVDINQGDNVGAKAFRAILDRIHDIKDDKRTNDDGTETTGLDIKKYYQDLRPTEVVNEANVYHPFFLENMSGQRPEFGARLSQTSATGYWRCVRQVEANDNLSVFYVRRNGAAGDNATYWLRNGEKTGVGNFLKHGTMSQNDEVEYVAHNATDSNGDGIPDDALEFKIDPVIPGVWEMRDVSDGNETGGSRYLTITGLGPTNPGHNYTIQYYDKSETSTLWKFKTFNDLDKIYLRPATKTGGMDFFCTFSYPLNIQIPKTGNPTPYYCSAAYRSTSAENAALKVVFEIVPSNATYYFLKGNEGYMFMTDETTAENLKVVDDASDTHNGYVYIDDAQFMSGPIPVALPENSMKANLNTTYVTSENWANIYALGNVSTGTQVGSFHGNPVYGIGVGFYHVRIGGKLNPNTAYIPRNRFVAVDEGSTEWTSVKEMSESGIPAEIIFKDEMGNIVDQIEVLPDGTTQRTADGPVYDLAGRRVAKPTHGIYIQNGRKVMYK